MGNIKLFEELVISEYDLSIIIKNYKFPKSYYAKKLKKFDQDIPECPIEFKEKIIKLKDKINFRTKNIIFMGYSNSEYEKYYFLQLTTKKSRNRRQSLYFEHIKGHKVYINTSKVFWFNFKKQKTWSSKFNANKENINQNSYWKSDMLNKMPRKTIKSLAKKTNINIYKNKSKEYDLLDYSNF